MQGIEADDMREVSRPPDEGLGELSQMDIERSGLPQRKGNGVSCAVVWTHL